MSESTAVELLEQFEAHIQKMHESEERIRMGLLSVISEHKQQLENKSATISALQKSIDHFEANYVPSNVSLWKKTIDDLHSKNSESALVSQSLKMSRDRELHWKQLYEKETQKQNKSPNSTISTVPSVPVVSSVPSETSVPAVPSVPAVSSVPAVPSVPSETSVHAVPSMSAVSSVPSVPVVSTTMSTHNDENDGAKRSLVSGNSENDEEKSGKKRKEMMELSASNNDETSVWEETIIQGKSYAFNKETKMAHARDADGFIGGALFVVSGININNKRTWKRVKPVVLESASFSSRWC